MSRVRRARGAPLGVHVAAYAVILLALVPVLRLDTPYTPDEGLYLAQVDALDDGTWEYDYWGARIDPDGDHFPLPNTERADGSWYPYVRHPAYVRLLEVGEAAAGAPFGHHVWGLLGAVLVAASSWWLAGSWDRRAARPAFWLAAGGPVLFNAYVIWAHALAAGLAGVATVGLVGAIQEPRRRWPLVLFAAGSAGAVLLRTEAVLWVAAAGAVLAWVLGRRGGWAGVARAGSALVAPVAAVVAERWWISSIVGSSASAGVDRGAPAGSGVTDLGDRLDAAWDVLVGTSYNDGDASEVGIIAVAFVVIAALIARWGGPTRRPMAVALLGAGSGLYAIRVVNWTDQPLNGVLAAWPAVLFALIVLRRPSGARGAGPVLVATGLYVLAVLATQYEEAGGLEWGGRFLHLALPALAAVGALALVRHPLGPGVRTGVILLAAVVAVAAPAALLDKRAGDDAQVEQIAWASSELIVVHDPVIPRIGWRLDPPLGWMVADPDEVAGVLEDVRDQGVFRVTLVQPYFVDPIEVARLWDAEPVPAPDVERFGWRLYRLTDTGY